MPNNEGARVNGTDEGRRQFHTLDMLRGLAALAVVGRHLGGVWLGWLPGSHLAVDLFFALSGFVIAHAYAARLSAGLGARAFMAIRVRRLYPLYLLGAVLGMAFAVVEALTGQPTGVGIGAWLGAVPLTLVFVPAPFFDAFHLFPFNSPSWSLLWELVVNAVYAPVAKWLTGPRLIAGLVVAAALLVASAVQFQGLDSGSNVRNWIGGPERVGYSFLAGVAVHRLWAAGRLSWLRLHPLLAGVALLAVFALRPHGDAPAYDAVMALVGFPLLVLAATAEPTPAWHGAFKRLGIASYAIYAIHLPLVKFEAAAVFRMGDISGLSRFAIETGFMAFVFVAALIADRWFDRPVRCWLDRWTQARRPGAGMGA